MDSFEKITKSLNEAQLEAVTTTEGYVRVIAGAGSGKTRALTSRYAYIVETIGINPSNILCVTFTNKAAKEMRNRVKKLIHGNFDLSYISTYHGFCVKVLREDINKLKYPKNFVIMDVEDQKIVLRSIYREMNLSAKDFTFKQILRYISKQKNQLEYLEYILESKKKNPKNPIEKIFIRYLEKQQRNFALDFDDLINFTLYIFNKFPDVLEKWQKRLHYIQVDETQDSSVKQFTLVEMLSNIHKNLFVVGDPDQTIYEWRGAKPEILVDFDKIFPDSKTILMNQNYRSTPNILNLGNHIIKNNKIRVDKDMFTQNTTGVDVVHFHAKNELDEGIWIAKEIKTLVSKKKISFSDFAILYRANFLSRRIEQAFIKEDIPYIIYGGIRFFERKEIKDILSYLRIIEIGDNISFLRVINTPRRGLGKVFIENLTRIAENENTSYYETLKNNISTKELNRSGAQEFICFIEKYKKTKDNRNISDLVKDILDKSGLTESYRTDGDTDRLDNIKELQNSIISTENEEGEKLSLAKYLQDISLYTSMDVKDENKKSVKLMTIHSSKGLEFPYVFLCGFTEGIIPSAMSIKERRAKAIEEERRLTYVAITRAEKGFYMTESEGYNFTTNSDKYPSRFLFEINDKFFVQKGELNQEIIDEAKAILNSSANSSLKENFKVGDFVNHQLFGKGEIKSSNVDKGEYLIDFKTIGIKPINFEFKGLTKINNEKFKPAKPLKSEQNARVRVNKTTNAMQRKSKLNTKKNIKPINLNKKILQQYTPLKTA